MKGPLDLLLCSYRAQCMGSRLYALRDNGRTSGRERISYSKRQIMDPHAYSTDSAVLGNQETQGEGARNGEGWDAQWRRIDDKEEAQDARWRRRVRAKKG